MHKEEKRESRLVYTSTLTHPHTHTHTHTATNTHPHIQSPFFCSPVGVGPPDTSLEIGEEMKHLVRQAHKEEKREMEDEKEKKEDNAKQKRRPRTKEQLERCRQVRTGENFMSCVSADLYILCAGACPVCVWVFRSEGEQGGSRRGLGVLRAHLSVRWKGYACMRFF